MSVSDDTGDRVSERKITLDDLWCLADRGLTATSNWQHLIRLIRDDSVWRLWIYRMLLVLGTLHVLAGVMFFFAFNWDDLSKTAQFTLLFSGVGGSFCFWWLLEPDSRVGELAGTGATFLTGVLMAVFGQIYQTGADAHDLFMAWALLTLPWAIVSRSPIHILVWIIIADVAYGLFANQVIRPLWGVSSPALLMINASILVVTLATVTVAARKYTNLLPWWLSGVLILGIALHLGAAGWLAAFNVADNVGKTDLYLEELLISLSLQGAMFAYFFKPQPNIFGCTMAQAAFISTVTLYVLVKIADAISGTAGFDLILMSAIVAGASALFIYVARQTNEHIRGRLAA